MPKLVRLYIWHCLIGFGLAAVFTGLLVAADVAHLGHLILTSPAGWLAGGLLVVLNGVVFSGVQFGIAVMALAADDAPRDGPGGPGRPVAVPVKPGP